jgi:hypothetical protein
MESPKKVGLTPGILQHAGPDVADRHYNLSRSMALSRQRWRRAAGPDRGGGWL